MALLDNIWVRLQFLQYGHFPHGSGGNSLIFILQLYFFESHQTPLNIVTSLEDNPVSSFPYSLKSFVALFPLHSGYSTNRLI